LPDEHTPDDFMYYFKEVLDKYSSIKKIGFGLKIDDLPDYYPQKNDVISWEKQFYTNEWSPGIFKSRIDTTFSLHMPGAAFQCWEETLRTGPPYLLRHMPWYENPDEISAETQFYQNTASSSSSWYNK